MNTVVAHDQKIIDLHSHTTASDGELTPVELVHRAENKNIDVLAITDHDTVAGLDVAKQTIIDDQLRLRLISGIEISTKWQGFEIHIVGLCIEPSDPVFTELVEQQRLQRIERAKQIAAKLVKKGFDGIYEEAKAQAGSEFISRTHFANVLLKRGAVSSFDQAFKKYLRKGKGAYVSPEWMSIEQAISVIHQAGGIAVIAHPIRYDMSNKWLKKLVAEFASYGGDAIEVGLCQVSPNQRVHVSSLAKEFNLYCSQGSDFHKPARWLELGRNLKLTDNCTPVWLHPRWRFY